MPRDDLSLKCADKLLVLVPSVSLGFSLSTLSLLQIPCQNGCNGFKSEKRGDRRISYHRKQEEKWLVKIPSGVDEHRRYPCVWIRKVNIHMLPQINEDSKECTVDQSISAVTCLTLRYDTRGECIA